MNMNSKFQISNFKSQIAKELDIPEAVITNIRRKEWGAVVGYFKYRWNQDGYAALQRNQGAVERVVKYFQGLKKYHVLNVSFETKKTIAMYIERLGVAPLLDDIKQALAANPRIKTLNYFIVTEKGAKTPRWGMLYFDKINKEWEERKEAEKLETGNLKFEIGERVTPDWVIDARKRIAELEAKRLTLDLSEFQEVAALRDRLEKNWKRD